MDEVTHLHIQQQGLIGILDIEGVKIPSSVMTDMLVSCRKWRVVAFTRMTFSAPSALPAIRLGDPRSTYLTGAGKMTWHRMDRILPNGDDAQPNEEGLKFYEDVFDECHKYGIEPLVTICHFDTPIALIKSMALERPPHGGCLCALL